MRFVHASQVEASLNEVGEHFADSGAKRKVEILVGSEVLIEDDANALEFLANYLPAYVVAMSMLVISIRMVRERFSLTRIHSRIVFPYFAMPTGA